MRKWGKMRNIKLLIQYDGSRYKGWQKQGNTTETIQEKLELLIDRITGEKAEVNGSGRTDAGVHALGQVANFKTNSGISVEELRFDLNLLLPKDIKILEASEVGSDFHARLSAKGKHYSFRVCDTQKPDVFIRKYVSESEEFLDVESMREAAGFMEGTKDFRSFCGNRRMKKSTIRTVKKIEINRDAQTDIVRLDFYGDGFLYNMVRIMSGTLILVGQGRLSPKDIPIIIKRQDRDAAGFTAAPQGLFLEEVFYEDDIW